MDLTFLGPMQYCSLQHQTLLLSTVISTTGHCFCFGSVSSSLVELYSSPVAYWAPTELESSSCVISFAFSYCSWGSQGLPGGLVVKENPPANAGDARRRFDPWVSKIPWRNQWQPTPVFLPGKSHGHRRLPGYSPWGCRRVCRRVRHDLSN